MKGNEKKMPNVYWYVLLTALSIVIFLYTLQKAKNRKVIPLYTFLSGLTYLFEYNVLVIFNSYVYHPNVLKNAYFDNILGAVVSDAFSVPMAGALIGALNLSWKWIFFIVGIFLFIENLFLYSDIYTHFWWNLFYTGLGLIGCFSISKKWYFLLRENLTIFVRFFTLYCTGILLQATAAFVLVAFFDLYHYKIGWFKNATRDHVAFATAYILFLSLILTTLTAFHIKWPLKIIIILLTFPLDLLLLKLDILHISHEWSLGYFLLLRLGILILLVLFNYFFLKMDKKTMSSVAYK
jgi:hypothetical protein